MAVITYDSPYKVLTKEYTWDTSSALELTQLDSTRAFRVAVSSLPAGATIGIQIPLLETPSSDAHWLTISTLTANGVFSEFDNYYKVMPHKVRLKQTVGATTSSSTKVLVTSKHIPPELTKP